MGVGVVGVGVVGESEGVRERTYNFVCPQVLLYVSSGTICVSSGTAMPVRLHTHACRTDEARTHQHQACNHARRDDACRCDVYASV